MKVNLFILLLVLSFQLPSGSAQEPIRFAKKYFSTLDNPEFNNVYVTDSCYWISGWGVDTVRPWNWNARFVKISLDGELLLNRQLVEPGKWFGWPRGIYFHNNKFYSSYLQPDDTARLVSYDIEQDQIENYYTYGRFYPNESGLFGGQIFVNNAGEQYLLSVTAGDSIINDDSTIQLIQLGSNKEVIQKRIYQYKKDIIALLGVKQAPNGMIWTYGFSSKPYYIKGNDNSQRDYLLILNAYGDSIMAIKGKSYFTGGIRDIHLDDDGNFICGTSILSHPVAREGILGYPTVIKMDSTGKAKWTLRPDSTDKCEVWASHSNIRRMVRNRDGSYTALAGIEIKYDSLDPVLPYWDDRICLFNFTSNGKKNWERTFSFGYGLERLQGQDLKSIDDGGYIVPGWLYLADSSSYIEASILIKTDSMGCLVPGCHLTVSIEDDSNSQPNELFRIYPNPIADDILFIQSNISKDAGILSIYTNNGLLVKNYKIKPDIGVQYLFNLPKLTSGMYIIKIEGKNYNWTDRMIKR